VILLGVSRLVSKRGVDIHSWLEWTWKLAWLYEVSKRRHQVKLHPSLFSQHSWPVPVFKWSGITHTQPSAISLGKLGEWMRDVRMLKVNKRVPLE